MEGDREIEQAIRNLQRVIGLPETGKITDKEAVKITSQRRCGMKDFPMGKRTKRYILEGTFWNSKVCDIAKYVILEKFNVEITPN